MPRCGDWTPASVPPPAKDMSSHTNTPVFPPSSFILLSFSWFYIFFSSGQVLLSTLSWCSACTSVSEGVLLMYLWREMYSTSTYSSAILEKTLESLLGRKRSNQSILKETNPEYSLEGLMLKLKLQYFAP